MTRRLGVGVGLWNMRSTARRPRAHAALYLDLQEDARAVEALGFDSLWLGEHRAWYDGWCPQPVLAGAAVLAATERLRVGTGIHLLPQHDPGQAAAVAAETARLFPGRLELGVGVGYRAAEFAARGRAIGDRGRLLRAGLDALRAASFDGVVRIGGRSHHTARRAVDAGAAVLLPPGLTQAQVEGFLALLPPGTPVGAMCDVWVDEDGDRARSRFDAILRRHYGEYARAWWARLPDGAPDEPKIAVQLDRAAATAVAGTPEEVAQRLLALTSLGLDLLVLQSVTEEAYDERLDQLELQARRLLPLLGRQT